MVLLPARPFMVASVSSAMAIRSALMRRRDSRCFSAHVGQRVWPGLGGLGQSRHWPSSLALCRFSWARRRRYSMRSGVWLLARSYSARFRFLSSAVEGSGSVRRFGATLVAFLALGFFLEDFPAVFFWFFEEFPELAGLGMGKLNSKVWPTARRGGVSSTICSLVARGLGRSPRLRGLVYEVGKGDAQGWSIPASAGQSLFGLLTHVTHSMRKMVD